MHHTTIISLPITQREKIKAPGLTSRYFRPTAHGTQATNQRSKYIMLITFFTHLDGKRAHLWTRHLDQNRLTLPFLFTLPRFSAFNSKLGRAIPNSHRDDAQARTVNRESKKPRRLWLVQTRPLDRKQQRRLQLLRLQHSPKILKFFGSLLNFELSIFLA